MDLPVELRFMAFTYAAGPFYADYAEPMEMLDWADGNHEWCFPLRILRLPAFALANKAVCREFLMYYFKVRVFRINVTVDMVAGWTRPDFSPELKAWLRRLEASLWLRADEAGRKVDPVRFRHISFRVREAENTMNMATINATIDVDYQAKSRLRYNTSLRFDESLNPPLKQGQDEVTAAYNLFCATLKRFANVNGIAKPGLSLSQLEVLMRCIDVNPDTRGKYLDRDFMPWDEEPDYEVADWREEGRNMEWIDQGPLNRYNEWEAGMADEQNGRATNETEEIGYGDSEIEEQDEYHYR